MIFQIGNKESLYLQILKPCFMSAFFAEFIGTALLIIFGNGVVANVVLNKTKGNNSGWIVITFGWAMAVFIGVYATSVYSGAHLNPAVTIADAIHSNNYSKIATYLPAQFLGAMLGAVLVWILYHDHFNETTDAAAQLACFATGPAIKSPIKNFITETVATFVFILCIFMLTNTPSNVQMGALQALPVALLVLGVGLSLGGPTGYAINPARDFGPRLMHYFLPIKNKGNSDWTYAPIPLLAPIVGAVLAALAHKNLF